MAAPAESESKSPDQSEKDPLEDVWDWTPAVLSKWVRQQSKSFKKASFALEKAGISGASLQNLSDQMLKDASVAKKDVRKKILRKLAELRKESGMLGVRNYQPQSDGDRPENTNVGTTDRGIFLRLFKWITSHGGDLSKVYFDPAERILRVRRTIKPQERILTVPPKLFMSTTLSRRDCPLSRIMKQGGTDPGTHTLIALLLLQEKRKDETSFWKPYLDVLPKVYSDIPIFWPEEEAAELQGDSLGRYQRRKQTLKGDYDAVAEKCGSAFTEAYSLDDFMWARTAVITRTFGLRVNSEKITANLPIDFLMHANQPDTTWGYDQNRGVYHITAVREIPQDKFLTITYGKKANARFLVNYGFCLPVNSRNKGIIHVPSADFVANPNQPANVRVPDERVELSISQESVTDTLKQVRTATSVLTQKEEYWAKEKHSIDLLHRLVEDGLAAFPTALDEDNARLAAHRSGETPLSPNVNNALLARTGEKLVLDFYRQLAVMLRKEVNNILESSKSSKSAEMTDAEKTKQRNYFFTKYLKDIRTFTHERIPDD